MMVANSVQFRNRRRKSADESLLHQLEPFEVRLAQRVQRLTHGIKFRKVLVVGTGADILAETLIEKEFAHAFVICDVTTNNLPFSRDPATPPIPTRIVADPHNLPFLDQRFDLCILLQALEHIQCPVSSLEDLQHVARYVLIESIYEKNYWTDFPSRILPDSKRETNSCINSLDHDRFHRLLADSDLQILRSDVVTDEETTKGSRAPAEVHLLFCRSRSTPSGEVCPRVLHVDTTSTRSTIVHNAILQDTIDYGVYTNISSWWRALEQKLRIDLILALHVRRIAEQYDVIMAGSEKVGVPLALMRLNRPLITTVHHMASPWKRVFLRLLRVTAAWTRTAYLSEADREVMMSYYGVPEDRLFKYSAAPLGRFRPTGEIVSEGPIMSIGLSDRDYPTLIEALRGLPGYHTEIYGASRYEDLYGVPNGVTIPDWIHLKDRVPIDELVAAYRRARFVVVPVQDTTQFSAGITAALEAQASGRAVIATRTQGMPDYVIDGVTGLLVAPGDVKGLREAISTLWNNPQLAQQMGLAGRRHVEMNFNPEVEDERLRNIVIDIWEASLSEC